MTTTRFYFCVTNTGTIMKNVIYFENHESKTEKKKKAEIWPNVPLRAFKITKK